MPEGIPGSDPIIILEERPYKRLLCSSPGDDEPVEESTGGRGGGEADDHKPNTKPNYVTTVGTNMEPYLPMKTIKKNRNNYFPTLGHSPVPENKKIRFLGMCLCMVERR